MNPTVLCQVLARVPVNSDQVSARNPMVSVQPASIAAQPSLMIPAVP